MGVAERDCLLGVHGMCLFERPTGRRFLVRGLEIALLPDCVVYVGLSGY